MGSIIKCCWGCQPPERNPYCHSTCPEYLEQKAEYERLKAIEDKKKSAAMSVMTQKSDGVRRALKNRKGKK